MLRCTEAIMHATHTELSAHYSSCPAGLNISFGTVHVWTGLKQSCMPRTPNSVHISSLEQFMSDWTQAIMHATHATHTDRHATHTELSSFGAVHVRLDSRNLSFLQCSYMIFSVLTVWPRIISFSSTKLFHQILWDNVSTQVWHYTTKSHKLFELVARNTEKNSNNYKIFSLVSKCSRWQSDRLHQRKQLYECMVEYLT